MKQLSEEVIHFFQTQGCVIVTTIDKKGAPHNSCKGIVDISPDGRIYLLDLYKARTYCNLTQNKHIAITAIYEHKFKGYCLKGRARILPRNKLQPEIIKAWEDRITARLTQRLIRNIQGEKGHSRHPEILLPEPEYLISVDVKEIVDLTPQHLK